IPLAFCGAECSSFLDMPFVSKRAIAEDRDTMELALSWSPSPGRADQRPLVDELISFDTFGQRTRLSSVRFPDTAGALRETPAFVNEFWTAKQRQAHSLHEVSYRACFKPQLPRFFIERLTKPGDVVYDPFMGR